MPLEPITRKEQFYSRIAGESGVVLEPITRKEHFLARIAGDADAKVLEPKTRTEHFLQQIIDAGGGGGSVTVEPLSVTENGTTTAPTGKAYSPVTVNVQSGGAQVVASGTFTGAGVLNFDFPVGKKMPKKDFIFRVYAPNDTEFAVNSDYKVAAFIADSFGTQYDLSSVSDNCPKTTLIKYTISGTSYTSVALANWYVGYIRSGAMYFSMQGNPTRNRVKRDANGFYIVIANYNDSWYFVSGMEYNWELLYIGSDPANDIVEVA